MLHHCCLSLNQRDMDSSQVIVLAYQLSADMTDIEHLRVKIDVCAMISPDVDNVREAPSISQNMVNFSLSIVVISNHWCFIYNTNVVFFYQKGLQLHWTIKSHIKFVLLIIICNFKRSRIVYIVHSILVTCPKISWCQNPTVLS